MKIVDHSLLEQLTDEEIQEMCRFADLDLLLIPMKAHPEFYKKYTKSLGRLEKKSALVQKFLPKYAFDLYEKGDERYMDAIALIAKNLKENFARILLESFEPVVTIEEIKKYSSEDYEVLYKKILDISATEISFTMFFVFLKLNEITFTEDEQHQLVHNLQKVVDLHELEEKLSCEKDRELKKKEKELLSVFEQEKSHFQKELSKCQKELVDAKKREKQYADELEQIKKRQEQEKRSLLSETLKKVEEEANNRKSELDRELNEYRKDRINEINDICDKKYLDKDAEINKLIENQENAFILRKQEIQDSIDSMNQTKNEIVDTIKSLTQEEEKRKIDLNNLKQQEQDFYLQLDQRALAHRLDELIFGEQKLETDEKKEQKICLEQNAVSVHRKNAFSQSAEESEYVEKLVDFGEDLIDNISLNFDNSTEISAIIISALLNGKALIVEDSIGVLLSESVSALIDAETPIIIEGVATSKDSLVKTINALDEKVIFVEGLLDDYNEIVFENLCRECNEKYLVFGISDMRNIKLFSKNLFNYALVLEVESELQFPQSDNILVGKHDISQYRLNFDSKLCHNYYNKYFRQLVANGIMNRRTSVDFSMLLQTYFYFISSNTLGEMIKKSILKCCDFVMDDEDIDKKEILIKSGVI